MILPEIVMIGIYDSQVVKKNTAISKERKTRTFEIELPVQDGGISHIDGKEMPITPNRMICAKPGQTRYTKFPYRCYYVHVIVRDEDLYKALTAVPNFFETDKTDAYREIFTELVNRYNNPTEEEAVMLQSLLLKLIYTLRKDVGGGSEAGKLPDNRFIIRKAQNYISDHLTEDLCLEQVARAVSLSKIYFHNLFKKAVGKTLREYVEEQRIKMAVDLLLTTRYSLTRIAYECGFSSQSYFSYVFKRNMKKTPREYVREIHQRYET